MDHLGESALARAILAHYSMDLFHIEKTVIRKIILLHGGIHAVKLNKHLRAPKILKHVIQICSPTFVCQQYQNLGVYQNTHRIENAVNTMVSAVIGYNSHNSQI